MNATLPSTLPAIEHLSFRAPSGRAMQSHGIAGLLRAAGELDVQIDEPAQKEGGFVGEHAVVLRAVCLLAEADVLHPIEQAVEGDVPFDACERCTGAGVQAATECDVIVRVLPIEPELVRVLELTRITGRGSE